MRSFFKLVVIPLPREIFFYTSLSKEQFLEKLSSESVRNGWGIGKPSKFIGSVNSDGFEGYYLNAEHSLSKSKMVLPVKIKVRAPNASSNEIHLEIAPSKWQSRLLRFSNGFILFWWVFWTLLTVVSYPAILKSEGTIFSSLLLMPLGVLLAPLAIYEMKKVPKRSLDCAEKYLTKYFSA